MFLIKRKNVTINTFVSFILDLTCPTHYFEIIILTKTTTFHKLLLALYAYYLLKA